MEAVERMTLPRVSLINGYLRYLRDRKCGESLALHELPPPYTVSTEDDPLSDPSFAPPPT